VIFNPLYLPWTSERKGNLQCVCVCVRERERESVHISFFFSGDECDVCVILIQKAICPAIVAVRCTWDDLQNQSKCMLFFANCFSLLTDMNFRTGPLCTNPFHQ